MSTSRARGRASSAVLFVTLVTLAPGTMGIMGIACKGDDACQAKLAAMRRTFEAIPADAATTQITILAPDFPLLTSARGEPLRATGPVVLLNTDGSANLDGGKPSFDPDVVLTKVAAALTLPGHDKVSGRWWRGKRLWSRATSRQ